ncbi:MAG: hypothetical protein K9I34_03765 [Bacteroidales bacterium]|nr:hypothetical protein [Bacteroidales bacterium]
MEYQHQPKKKSLAKKIILAIWYTLLLFVFVILMIKQLSPVSKINQFLDSVESDSLYIRQNEAINNHSDLVDLTREEAYLKALLELSNSDSAQLTLNLKDSTICLYLKGVKVHEARIKEPEVDIILRHLPNSHYLWLFSRPIPVREQFATFEKEPIIVKDAPKDTIEAAANNEIIVRENEPAFVHLKMAHDIDLIIEQDSLLDNRTKWARYEFNYNIIKEDYLKTIRAFFSSGKMETHPVIRLKVPTDDLVSLYRALPHDAEIVIRY